MNLTTGHLWILALPCDLQRWDVTHHEALSEVGQVWLPNQRVSVSQMVVLMNLLSRVWYFVREAENRLLQFLTLAWDFTCHIQILIQLFLIGIAPKQWFQNIYIDFVFFHFCVQLSAEVSQTAGTLNPSTYFQTVSPAGAAPVPTIEECGEVWCYFRVAHAVFSRLARAHSHQSQLWDSLGIFSFSLGIESLLKVRVWLIKRTNTEEN